MKRDTWLLRSTYFSGLEQFRFDLKSEVGGHDLTHAWEY
jgi:hypothetical protein